MCVFNGLEDTRACLESLRATTEPFRLVVMDNGSTDGTTEFFTRFPYPYALTFARSPQRRRHRRAQPRLAARRHRGPLLPPQRHGALRARVAGATARGARRAPRGARRRVRRQAAARRRSRGRPDDRPEPPARPDGSGAAGGRGLRRLGLHVPAPRPDGDRGRLRRGLWLLSWPRPRPLARGPGARPALPRGPGTVPPPRRADPHARLRPGPRAGARRPRHAGRGARALRSEVASPPAVRRALRAPADGRLAQDEERTPRRPVDPGLAGPGGMRSDMTNVAGARLVSGRFTQARPARRTRCGSALPRSAPASPAPVD